MENKISVIIAEDHELFRDGLEMLLRTMQEINLVATAKNGIELIEFAKIHSPNVILTDIKMPDMNGIETTKYLTQNQPNIGIIALSMFNDGEQVVQMLHAGGKGYILKDATKLELYEAIKTVDNGGTYFCKRSSNALGKYLNINGSKALNLEEVISFNDTEMQIIQLLADGLTSKEIGQRIFLSHRTIEGYKTRLQEKIKVNSIAGVIRYAIKHNLIT